MKNLTEFDILYVLYYKERLNRTEIKRLIKKQPAEILIKIKYLKKLGMLKDRKYKKQMYSYLTDKGIESVKVVIDLYTKFGVEKPVTHKPVV